MAAQGVSCAAGAAHTLPSPTAWSGLVLDPFVEGRFSDAKRTPQDSDARRFKNIMRFCSHEVGL